MSPQSNVADYRKRCLAKGTYLAAPTEEFTWFTVEATKVSYLIRASDAPPPDTVLEPSDRPAPVELAMIVKVAENNWWFRSEANWTNPKTAGPFEKLKLTFIAEPPKYDDVAEDFEVAKVNLNDLMAVISNPEVPTEGGFTENGIKIRHPIFGHRDDVTPEVAASSKFKIAKWPVFTKEAKAALTDIAETHFIRTPPIYDLPGQLVMPGMYFRRFRGATVIVKFTFSFYKWEDKNTFCADLAHLRVLVTPSPLTPVTPRYKHSVDFDPEFPIFKPDFKKAKTQHNAEDQSE